MEPVFANIRRMWIVCIFFAVSFDDEVSINVDGNFMECLYAELQRFAGYVSEQPRFFKD